MNNERGVAKEKRRRMTGERKKKPVEKSGNLIILSRRAVRDFRVDKQARFCDNPVLEENR